MPNSNNWLSFHLPNTLLDEIVIVQEKIGKDYPNFKKMDRSGLHMTVFFFGEKLRNRDMRQKIEAVVTHTFKELCAELKFKKYIYFPEDKKSSVVASYKIDKRSEITISKFEKIMKQYDISTSFDVYHPHITLGRLKGKTEYGDLDYTGLSDFNATDVVMCGKS